MQAMRSRERGLRLGRRPRAFSSTGGKLQTRASHEERDRRQDREDPVWDQGAESVDMDQEEDRVVPEDEPRPALAPSESAQDDAKPEDHHDCGGRRHQELRVMRQRIDGDKERRDAEDGHQETQ